MPLSSVVKPVLSVFTFVALLLPLVANAQEVPPQVIQSCMEEPREPGETRKIVHDEVSVSSSGDVVRIQGCNYWPPGSDPETDTGYQSPFLYQLGNIGPVDRPSTFKLTDRNNKLLIGKRGLTSAILNLAARRTTDPTDRSWRWLNFGYGLIRPKIKHNFNDDDQRRRFRGPASSGGVRGSNDTVGSIGTEGSPAFVMVNQIIPADMPEDDLGFAFAILNPGDGDWLTVTFDGEVVFLADLSDFLPDTLYVGLIAKDALLGRTGMLQVTLNDAGQRNAVIYLPDAESAVFTPEGEICDDGVDNDEDGLIDANDEDCQEPDVLTSPTLTPDPNSAGWHRQDVSVSLQAVSGIASDPIKEIVYSMTGATTGSGVFAGDAGTLQIVNEGVTTVSYYALTTNGIEESQRTLTVQLDKTPPSIVFGSPLTPPNARGWYASDVTMPFTLTDNASGVPAVNGGVLITSEGGNASALATASDLAGNIATLSSPSVALDKTRPTVSCSGSPTALFPPKDQLARVDTLVSASDALSGLAGSPTLTGINASSIQDIAEWTIGTLDLRGLLRATVGREYGIVYGARDQADNLGSCIVSVTVPDAKLAKPPKCIKGCG